ncbi:hypothetical protein QP149_26240, partial [Escherichia coli]|nr:hypothetical protein [Escherichia coli]
GGEDDFIVLEEVGEKPQFDFEPKDHLELGETLGLIDVTVRRNAFGNQRFSEERTVPVAMEGQRSGEPLAIEASFIRAPIVTRAGEGVEVIA